MKKKFAPEARRILKYIRPYGGYIFLAVITAVGSVALSLFAPILIGNIIGLIVGKGAVDFLEMGVNILALGATILGSALLQLAMTRCTNKVTYHTVQDMRTEIFAKLAHVPLSTLDRTPHGDILSRMVNDVDQISDGLLQGFAQFFTGIITILGTLLFMLRVDYKITLVVVLVTPLSLFVAAFIAKRAFKFFKEQSDARGELSAYVEEHLNNQKLVKAFSYEERAEAEFAEINSRLQKSGVMAQLFSSITNPATRFVNGIVYAAVGITGAISAINGGISVGQLTTFLLYANQYTKPFNEITGVLTELQSAFASARRVFALLDEAVEQSDEGQKKLESCDGSVALKNVNFSYKKGTPLIENLNITVKAGQRVAIVGPTGCGKTTIINLIMRFYDVDSGEIIVSGHPIKSLTRRSLRQMYGMVLQETWLFSGTVRDNIAYGNASATDEEIIAAAKLAFAHGFISRLPRGYDTLISEDGGNISGGERQLLCIARIMLTKPPMLILDEATSSIDTRTELLIQKAFARMMEGRTSFVVAHRLSTIREADVILVMDKGHIVEQGCHEELLASGGFYAKLYKNQFIQASEEKLC